MTPPCVSPRRVRLGDVLKDKVDVAVERFDVGEGDAANSGGVPRGRSIGGGGAHTTRIQTSLVDSFHNLRWNSSLGNQKNFDEHAYPHAPPPLHLSPRTSSPLAP